MEHHTKPSAAGRRGPASPPLPEEYFCPLPSPDPVPPGVICRTGRRRVTAGALLVLAGLTAAGAMVVSTCTLCYAVAPEGSPPLAFVSRAETYTQAVCQVEEQVSAILEDDYAYEQPAQVSLTIAPRERVQTSQELADSLMETVEQVRSAWVLTVDGSPAGACADRESIDRALAQAETHYATADATAVTCLSQVAVTEDYLPAEEPLLTADDLTDLLLEAGENGPLLQVETVEETTYTQLLPAPVQEEETADLILGQRATLAEGSDGQEVRTDRVTYRCGVEVARENLAAETCVAPVPTRVGVGTAQGAEAAQGRFLWPVTGRITSPFGPRYLFGTYGFHTGIDIANAAGMPLQASAAGTVRFAGAKGSYGNLVQVDHGNGFVTYYAHCAQLLVEEGEAVEQGQPVALLGSTGRSTGPHCHFEIRWQEEPIDPALCLPELS